MNFSALISPPVRPPRAADARMAVVLSVGENDSSGRGGLPMDLRVFAACAVHSLSVVTSVRAAALRRSFGSLDLPPDAVQRQLLAVHQDLEIDAAKIGYLGNEGILRSVCETLETHPIEQLVVDPEMVTSNGESRFDREAIRAIKGYLLPKASIAVFNSHEAELLTDRRVEDRASMKEACRRLRGFNIPNVLITGGRLEGHAVDVFFDGSGFLEFGHDRLSRQGVRGAGACLSAAITVSLARGAGLSRAIDEARVVVIEAIKASLPLTVDARSLDPLAPHHEALSLDSTPRRFELTEEDAPEQA